MTLLAATDCRHAPSVTGCLIPAEACPVPAADQPGHFGAQPDELRQFPGGDLVPGRGQVHRQVRADAPWTRGEHDHPVADVDALVDVVGYQQDGDVPLPAHPEHQVLQVLPGLRVHRAERLVHQEQHGIGGKRAGDRDPLLHAAGQLARVLVAEPPHPARPDKPDRGERGVGRLPPRRAGPRRAAQRQCHVVPHGQPRVQRPAVVLEDHGQPLWDLLHGLAAQHDPPGGRPDQPADAAQQGRLAAAGRADDGDEFPPGDAQAYPVDRQVGGIAVAVGPGQVRYLEHVSPAPCRCARKVQVAPPRRAAR